MTATQYATAVIETAISNGMTLEQIASANPSELAAAHLHCQLKATEEAGKQALTELSK